MVLTLFDAQSLASAVELIAPLALDFGNVFQIEVPAEAMSTARAAYRPKKTPSRGPPPSPSMELIFRSAISDSFHSIILIAGFSQQDKRQSSGQSQAVSLFNFSTIKRLTS
jgi:hypothetical protein